ncbi:MAG TPA: hypothetical protein VHD36_21845 [Pirellulales bacterium]|nr:hypothetical protein [Pirellulales bacterium]
MKRRKDSLTACQWTGVILAVLLTGITASATGADTKGTDNDDAIWELLPYQVRVVIGPTPRAFATGHVVSDLAPAVAERAWAIVGGRWACKAEMADGALREALNYQFDDLTAEKILPAADGDCDKIMLVRLSFDDGVYGIAARDFDVRTQLLGPAVESRVFHASRLPDAILQALLAAFTPLARVEEVSGDKVTLRLRAAAVPTRDPAVDPSFDKSIFRPVVRVRSTRSTRVQPIDWTYLVTESVEGSRLATRLVTGLRTPLVNKRRGRAEQLALYVHPPHGTTTLQLRTADKQERPLSGYQVYSHPVDSKETLLLGSTDVRGDLVIEPGDGGVRVLLVKSGGVIMARLPVLPGLQPVALAQVPDDHLRLQVEGVINGFQEELVDQIARRQALISRIRSRLKAGKTDQARELLNELRRLRSQQDFTRELLVERQRRTSNDPRTQRQIDKLFDDTQTVINRYLDARQVERLEREVGEDTTAQAAAPAQDGT